MFHVEIAGEYGDEFVEIHLVDRVGFNDDPLVMWTSDEWVAEPSLVAVIANAIRIGFTEGPDAIRERINPS